MMKTRRYAGILSLFYFSTGLLAAVLSLVLLDKGLSLGGIALAMGIYSVTAAALEVPSGIAADLLGRRMTFLISLALSAAAYALMIFLRGPWLMAAVAVNGAARAMASGTVEALFISRHNAAYGVDRLPKAMRLLTLSESAGLAVGALLGGFLPSISAALLPGWGAYDLNLLLRAAMCPLLAVLTVLWIPSDRGERPERVPLSVHLRESARVVRHSHALKWVLLAAVGLGIALCALEAYWQPLFLGLLGGENRIALLGVLSTLYFGAVMAGNLVSERLLSRHGMSEKTVYLAGRFGMLVCMVGAALIPHPAAFMVLYCLMYFFLGASNISEGALIHREVPDASRASMLSVQSFMMQAGVLAASAGAGAAADTVSLPVLWLAAAAAAALLLAPALRIAKRLKPEDAEYKNPPTDLPCGGEESTET